MSPAEVQDIVENWRDQILAAIAVPEQAPYTPWPEGNEKPYYTDKPDWDAFGAMLLVAACPYIRGTGAAYRGERLGLHGGPHHSPSLEG